jgi:hypothetical protein
MVVGKGAFVQGLKDIRRLIESFVFARFEGIAKGNVKGRGEKIDVGTVCPALVGGIQQGPVRGWKRGKRLIFL